MRQFVANTEDGDGTVAARRLAGALLLSPQEELAHRRLQDLARVTDDHLPDEPRSLGWLTRAGTDWPCVRSGLLALRKIEITDDGHLVVND